MEKEFLLSKRDCRGAVRVMLIQLNSIDSRKFIIVSLSPVIHAFR